MNENREKIFKYLSNHNNLKIQTFISKDIAIYKNVKIGLGSIIFPGSVVEPYSTIGNGSVLWFGAHICHHTNIGDFVWVAAKPQSVHNVL